MQAIKEWLERHPRLVLEDDNGVRIESTEDVAEILASPLKEALAFSTETELMQEARARVLGILRLRPSRERARAFARDTRPGSRFWFESKCPSI